MRPRSPTPCSESAKVHTSTTNGGRTPAGSASSRSDTRHADERPTCPADLACDACSCRSHSDFSPCRRCSDGGQVGGEPDERCRRNPLPPFPHYFSTMNTMTSQRARHGKRQPQHAAFPIPPAEPRLPVDRSIELALQAIAEAAGSCEHTTPVVLDEEYLAWIAAVEAMPCNRSGSDKTWLHDLHASDDAYFRSCRQVP